MFGLSKRIIVVIGIFVGVLGVYLFGSDPEQVNGTESASSPGGCRVTVTADVLNIRAGPTTAAPVVEQLGATTETDAGTTVQDGFRRLALNRWAADEYLQPMAGRDCG